MMEKSLYLRVFHSLKLIVGVDLFRYPFIYLLGKLFMIAWCSLEIPYDFVSSVFIFYLFPRLATNSCWPINSAVKCQFDWFKSLLFIDKN